MIDLARDGAVFVLRMCRGENRIDRAFLDAFHRALDDVEGSTGAAALVTTGEGRFFSNGLDLAGLAGAGAAEAEHVLTELQRLFGRLLAFPVATVAAISGHAFAGGAMLALAHGARVMRSDRGFFCLPEVDLATGRSLTPGMYALLGARLERTVLHELLVTGRRLTAAEAVARGIAGEARPDAELLPRAVEIARARAGADRATREALARGLFGRSLARLARG